MPEQIQVRNKIIQVDENMHQYYECSMSDGSIWSCDMEGNNWKKVILEDSILTQKFNDFISPKHSVSSVPTRVD